jgi:hypothetical protein
LLRLLSLRRLLLLRRLRLLLRLRLLRLQLPRRPLLHQELRRLR